jgi:hypothetical protein
MDLAIWVVEGFLTISVAFIVITLVCWFISQFNKD